MRSSLLGGCFSNVMQLFYSGGAHRISSCRKKQKVSTSKVKNQAQEKYGQSLHEEPLSDSVENVARGSQKANNIILL